MRIRRGLTLSAAVALCIASTGCWGIVPGDAHATRRKREESIVVGVSGAFTENQIVAEMYAQVLEHAGYTVERQLDLRSRELSQTALESGQIDLKPEYLSSLLLFVDPNAEASNDPATSSGASRPPRAEGDRRCSRRHRLRTPTCSWRTPRRPGGSG